MGGRNRQPLKILEATGKKHLTKEEKELRKKSEVKLPSGKIKCPKYVKNNLEAYRKWKEILPILKAAEIVVAADVGSLARYCIAFSEYLDLLRMREETVCIEPFSNKEEGEIEEFLEEKVGKRAANKMWDKVQFIFTSQSVLAIDKAINNKMSTILALEDRLFLNILSRVKNVIPKEDMPKVDDKKQSMFGS